MLSLNPLTNSNERQIVLHVDMDAFFASVELREKPELKGLPVVVGADPKKGKGRGVVCTCSYEARESGIHSAMPVSQAYKLCPDAAFLPVNIRLYVQVSDNVMEIMKGFADKFQQYSIDEAFLVPGPDIKNFEEAEFCALRIKDEIKTGHFPESSLTFRYIEPSFFGIELESDAFEKAERKIKVPETILRTLKLKRVDLIATKVKECEQGYRTIFESYKSYGLVEFKMFNDLLVMSFEGKDAPIPDEILMNTEEGIKVPGDLIQGVPELLIDASVLETRDKTRAKNAYKRNFKTITVKNGFEFVLNGDRLLIRHGNKEATCTEIETIYGRPAVKITEIDVGHPYIELPAEVEEAFKKVLGNKVPDGLKIVPAGKSLLDGANYSKLNMPISEELFNSVKMYFTWFGEESGDFSGTNKGKDVTIIIYVDEEA